MISKIDFIFHEGKQQNFIKNLYTDTDHVDSVDAYSLKLLDRKRMKMLHRINLKFI